MYRHEKKITGFTPNLGFNPLPTRFNHQISARRHAFREYAAHKGEENE